jgi:hypothetical protein
VFASLSSCTRAFLCSDRNEGLGSVAGSDLAFVLTHAEHGLTHGGDAKRKSATPHPSGAVHMFLFCSCWAGGGGLVGWVQRIGSFGSPVPTLHTPTSVSCSVPAAAGSASSPAARLPSCDGTCLCCLQPSAVASNKTCLPVLSYSPLCSRRQLHQQPACPAAGGLCNLDARLPMGWDGFYSPRHRTGCAGLVWTSRRRGLCNLHARSPMPGSMPGLTRLFIRLASRSRH